MRILIAAVALAMTLVGTANAQNHPSDHRPGQQQSHQPSRPAPKPVARSSHSQAPKYWKGSHANWQRHVTQCQRKFRSYNPRTDRYTVRGNQTAICRL